MPVVVLGGDAPRGAAVVAALLDAGVPEVRAVVGSRAAQRVLVAHGVRTAVLDPADPPDPERLGAVLRDAHTVVDLDGADPGLLAEALAGSGVRRLVVTSPWSLAPRSYDVVVVEDGPGLAARVVEADGRG